MFLLKAQEFPNNEKRVILTLSRRSQCPKEPTVKVGSFSFESHSDFGESQGETGCKEGEQTSLTLGAISKRSLRGYGERPRPTKFGLRARRTLLRAGGAMDSLPGGVEKRVFFTGTLPGSTPEAMTAISAWSAWIVNAWKAWVSRRIRSKYDFYVWELQKRGALHFHYCIYIERDEDREWFLREAKKEWVRLLEGISDKSGIDLFARQGGGSWRGYHRLIQAYAQPCRKSVAAYLSKYCGKSVGKSTGQYFPSRWWGVSRELRFLLRKLTFERVWSFARRSQAEAFFEDLLHSLEASCPKGYRKYVDKSGFARVAVGYSSEAIWIDKGQGREDYSNESRERSAMVGRIGWRLRDLISFASRFSVRQSEFSAFGLPGAASRFSQWGGSSLENILIAVERSLFALYWRRNPQALEAYETLRGFYVILSRAWRTRGCSRVATLKDLSASELEDLYAALCFGGVNRTGDKTSAVADCRSHRHGDSNLGRSSPGTPHSEAVGVRQGREGYQPDSRDRRGWEKPLGSGDLLISAFSGEQLCIDGVLESAGGPLDSDLRYPVR